MPYIENYRRMLLNTGHATPRTIGELNYVITKACVDFMKHKNQNYELHNAVMGALECAKQEFYRRKLGPYEKEKCKIHGDVYE